MLKVENLTIGYGEKAIASGLSFELGKGTVTALLGANGIGKSTLFKTISGELKALGGSVEIDGENALQMKPREMAKVVSLVTTDRVNVASLTVRQLVSLGRQPHTGFFGRLSSADRLKVEEAIRSAGILHKAESFLTDLSDGERQKAMIARAIAQDTPLMLLDEPFSFLDVASRIEILALLKKMAAETGKCILFSSHDVAQALRMADRLLLLLPPSPPTSSSFPSSSSPSSTTPTLLAGSPKELIANGSISRLFTSPAVIFSPSQTDFIAST